MSLLDHIEIFAGMSETELQALHESSLTRQYPKNTVIINEGDNAGSLYVIESGRVKIYCSDKNGKEFIINTMDSGDYFGELALLDDNKRSASVRTMERSTFRVIYKEDFNRVLEEHPNIARTLTRNLTRNVRVLTDKVKTLALHDVYERVAEVLTQLAEPRDNDCFYIEERLTQQEIADRVGASREMVARILKDLTVGDYISFEGRNIVINGRLPAHY